jgi:arabinogalactan endo-1,4-beta-galactosidase
MPKIVIHIASGANWGGTRWFMDNLILQQARFDIIGESYYPELHGPLTNLSTCLIKTPRRYNKAVFVAETSFPWASSTPTNLYGIPVSTNGQVQYVVALAPVVKGLPGGMVNGVFWWDAEYPGSWNSFFTGSGNVLPVAGAFGQLTAPIQLDAGVTGNNLTLAWPLSGAGMSLESSTVLSALWQPVTNAVQNTGTVFVTTVPFSIRSNGFYRLRAN